MNIFAQLQQAAELWIDRNQRDVAEIRLDDLLDPACKDAITNIAAYSIEEALGFRVVITQESGALTRIDIGGSIAYAPGK